MGDTGPHALLLCTECYTEHSAHAGDYWFHPDDFVLTCHDKPLVRVHKVVTYVPDRPATERWAGGPRSRLRVVSEMRRVTAVRVPEDLDEDEAYDEAVRIVVELDLAGIVADSEECVERYVVGDPMPPEEGESHGGRPDSRSE
jgi:hypothetical protein